MQSVSFHVACFQAGTNNGWKAVPAVPIVQGTMIDGDNCLLKVEEGTVQLYMKVGSARLKQGLSDMALRKKGKSSKPKYNVFNLNLCNYFLKSSLRASSHPVTEEDILATPGVLSFVSCFSSVFFSAYLLLAGPPSSGQSNWHLDMERSKEWTDYIKDNADEHDLFCWAQSIMTLE